MPQPKLGYVGWAGLALSGSLWRSLVLSGALWLSLALSGALWLSLELSGCLWLSQTLSQTSEGSFTDPLTGPCKSPLQTLQGSMTGFMRLLKQAFSLGAGYAVW